MFDFQKQKTNKQRKKIQTFETVLLPLSYIRMGINTQKSTPPSTHTALLMLIAKNKI